jgi:hypothetical protein
MSWLGSMLEKEQVEHNAMDFEMFLATTSIPLEINTTPHRHALIPSKFEISIKIIGHFAHSFQPQLFSKAMDVTNSTRLISSSNFHNRDIVSRDPPKFLLFFSPSNLNIILDLSWRRHM